MQEEDARIASSQAVLAAKLAGIASLEAGFAADIASFQAELEADIAEQCRYLSLLEYGEGITQAVPAIQAWMRGILTRRRVHCALLSADPDALAMAMWM